MTSFGWLHLSDLHQGMDGQGWLWPNVREQLFEDLGKLHKLCGPWDVVLFTGDLTQRGSAAEYDLLTKTLAQLWARLRELGSEPVLLAVPGNHDLARPDNRKPVVKALSQWHADVDIRREFWADPASDYRAAVREAFAGYERWWKGHPLPRPRRLSEGMLPGDFAATLEKGGARLGVLGLNSTFLQLTGGDHSGRLDLGVAQLHGACGGDGVGWVDDHHACLLLTHHPPDWLSEAGKKVLRGEIAPPGRFAIHLFGHMHEGTTQTLAVNGSQPWRDWQGGSLFGLESWGQAGEKRRHGYSAGRLELAGNKGFLRIWPRIGVRRNEGFWRIVPDVNHFDLEDDAGTRAEPIRLRRLLSSPPPGPGAAIPFSPSVPAAPGPPNVAAAAVAPPAPPAAPAPAPGAVAAPRKKVQMLLAYSKQEEELARALRTHLAPLVQQGLLEIWDESRIAPGRNVADEWSAAIARADMAVLLVSATYLAEDDLSPPRSLFRRVSDGSSRSLVPVIVPVLARPCSWDYGPLAGKKPLPENGKPISTWAQRDEALHAVETGLRSLVETLGASPARVAT